MRAALRFAFVLGLAAAFSAPAMRAAELRVALAPPHDPDGLLWKIELRSVEPDALLGEYGTAIDGTWSRRGLAPKSRVLLVVKTDSGQPWWKSPEPIVLEEDVTERKIALGLVKVKGTLTWGGGPISALLKFVDERVGTRMEVRADREGTFAIGLPRLGDWDVTVHGKRPSVNEAVRADVFEDRDGVARTAIALDSGCVCGEVVDEDGKAVPSGFVHVTGSKTTESDWNIRPEADGTFRDERLPPGTYRVHARAIGLVTQTVEVELQARLGAPWVTLVAKKESVIRGRVIDAAGQPVKEVTLRAVAPPGVLLGGERPDRTKDGGEFELGVYPGLDERCVTVVPRISGHDLVKLKVNVDDQIVTLQPPPSTIAPVHLPKAGRGTWLVRNGCAAPLWLLAAFPGGESGAFARLARGAWSVCPGEFAQLAKGIPFAGCSTIVVP